MAKENQRGDIIIKDGINVWPHEMHSAIALAHAGYRVKFVPANNALRSADVYLNETLFEFKAPLGKNIGCVERNIKRALVKCPNIVIDSCRIKNVQDRSIQSFLISRLKHGKGIKRLIFVNRSGIAIDINCSI